MALTTLVSVLALRVLVAVVAVSFLAGCGGDGSSTATTDTTGTNSDTTAASAPPLSDADQQKADSILLTSQDVSAAAQAANPQRPDSSAPRTTDFRGTEDINAQRDECGVARPGTGDRYSATGPHLLVPDPIDGKSLYVNSQVVVKRDQASAEDSLAALRNPATLACLRLFFQRQVAEERDRQGVTPAQLVASESIEPLQLENLGSRTVAYRFHEEVTIRDRKAVDQYVDLLVTYSGVTQVTIVVESSFEPPSPEFDRALIDQARSKAVRIRF